MDSSEPRRRCGVLYIPVKDTYTVAGEDDEKIQKEIDNR